MAQPRRQNLLTLFRRSAQAMVEQLVARVAAAGHDGIRLAHSQVFEALAPEGSRISELAAHAQMTHQSMSELVASLEELGYVERRADPSDGRAKLICLTDQGHALMQLALQEIERIEAAWLHSLRQQGIAGDLAAALKETLRSEMRRTA